MASGSQPADVNISDALEGDGMEGDYNEFRVLEVLVDEHQAVTALRIEAIWGSTRAGADPVVWDRTVFTAAATGPLAGAEVGTWLDLRPLGDNPPPDRGAR